MLKSELCVLPRLSVSFIGYAVFVVLKKLVKAIAVSLALFVALNAATYLLRARSDGVNTYLRVGFPLVFWREGSVNSKQPHYSRFRPAPFCANIAFAFWVSYRIGRWWERRGTPDYLTGTKT